jgi:hypothetical protein
LYFLFCGLSLQIIFPFAHWVLDSLWVAKLPVYSYSQSLVRCIEQNIFSHSVGCLYSQVIVSFTVQSLLVWCGPICQLFLLVAELLESYSRSYYLCLPVSVFSHSFI